MQALVETSKGSEDDQAVFRSCYTILFFTIPNRGLDNSRLMSMATERLEKVYYALLSMSSDDPSAAGLSANCKTSWEGVFRCKGIQKATALNDCGMVNSNSDGI
jgi:hypothetical protein